MGRHRAHDGGTRSGRASGPAPVLALASAKGGVGKTTAAVVLAALAARGGARVLVWDLDAQGAASWLLGVDGRRKHPASRLLAARDALADVVRPARGVELDVVPADASLRTTEEVLGRADRPERRLRDLLGPARARYDLVVLDCPPGTALLAGSVAHAADLLLVPVPPSPLAVRTLSQLGQVVAESARKRTRVLAYASQVDRRRRLHADGVAALLARPDVARTVVPSLAAIEQLAPGGRLPPWSPTSPAGVCFAALWDEVRAGVAPGAGLGTVRA